MSVTRQRLTNFSPAGRVAETRSTDFNGNVTTVTTDLDRAAGTAITTTTTTGITSSRLETKVAGLTVSVRGHDNLTTRTGYDPFLRPATNQDSRTNTTTTAFVPGSSLVSSVKISAPEPTGTTIVNPDTTGTIVAFYTYDTTGRPTAQSGARDAAVVGSPRHTTYTRYNLRGQPERQWGDAALPVSFAYDVTTGDRLTLSTYRAGTGWSNATWPAATDIGTVDATTWTYDPPTGLLVSKTDAAGALVRYTYNSRGQLTRRTWARGTTTDYTYDSATAEQRDIDYSDGTAALHYAYNRLAQTTQIDDATGSHFFTHCICGKLESERFDLLFYSNRLLTYSLNANSALGPLGRTTGFTLTTASAATEQTVAFAYDPTGTHARLTQVTATIPAIAATGHAFNYAYLTNSGLIEQLSVDSGSTFTITRTFEAQRDVLTSIDSTWGAAAGSSHARYDYETDALGQRTSVKQNGSAFADYYDPNATNNGTTQTFAYDARGQLTAALTYLGIAATTGQELQRRQHQFAYDNIGNRTSSNRTGTADEADTYTANALNQYTARTHKTIPLSGTAATSANVVVHGPTATSAKPAISVPTPPVLANRRGRYWAADYAAPNGPPTTTGNQPWRGPLDLYFGQVGLASAPDLVRLDTRMAQIPARAQVLTYDADGNLTNDGIWGFTWDARTASSNSLPSPPPAPATPRSPSNSATITSAAVSKNS
jgi:YD repeat-containing protein